MEDCAEEEERKMEQKWKRRVGNKYGRTKNETARPQGQGLSFYGHDKLRRRRGEATSGLAVGNRGLEGLGKGKEEGKEEDRESSLYKVG